MFSKVIICMSVLLYTAYPSQYHQVRTFLLWGDSTNHCSTVLVCVQFYFNNLTRFRDVQCFGSQLEIQLTAFRLMRTTSMGVALWPILTFNHPVEGIEKAGSSFITTSWTYQKKEFWRGQYILCEQMTADSGKMPIDHVFPVNVFIGTWWMELACFPDVSLRMVLSRHSNQQP